MATVPAIDDTTLDDLCRRLGIEPGFVDYQGEHHAASPEVRRLLVGALGFTLDDQDDAQSVREQLRREAWREGVPYVAVLHADRDKAVEICIPETGVHEQAHWSIEPEQGETLNGAFSPADLEYLDTTAIDGRVLLRYRLRFPDELPLGYHRLSVRTAAEQYAGTLIVTPERCYCPDEDSDERCWGFSLQLYALRSDTNWGIGDFTDLREFIGYAAKAGADFIGVNPLHALYPANPDHASPYSPSSRLYINYLYLDVTAVAEYDECPELREWVASAGVQKRLGALRAVDHVDYAGVAELKFEALEQLYRRFVDRHLDRHTERARRFQAFVEREGDWLVHQAAYDALFEDHRHRTGLPGGWQQWQSAFDSPDSPAVRRFIDSNPARVGFYQYLQWLCAEQFEQAHRAALDAGMRIGLYRDLAVGVQGDGAEAWSGRRSFSFHASVGAPPDPLALQGQDWGLPPLNPRGLQQTAYAVFIKLLQANMRHAGALRIDHVMALLRLWWIPRGREATDGAYVYYPFDDLLGILKLESQRKRCRIIGEDLGTVPEQIRGRLPEAGVYSYRVMYFEKQHDGFKPPRDYPRRAMATVTTHDLATLAGWWEGVDLAMRDELELFPTDAIREREYRMRDEDRRQLLAAMVEAGVWPYSPRPEDNVEATPAFSAAVHAYLAKSRSVLMAVQPEDLLLMKKPVNVPGTVDAYPNWRRKLSTTVSALFNTGATSDILAAIGARRHED